MMRIFAFDRQDGFTLMEMIVVLAIVAMVMTSVVAFATRPSNVVILRQTAAQVEALMQAARARALVTNTEVRVDFDRENGAIASDGLGKSIEFSADITVTMTTARQELQDEKLASIRFLPDGRSTGGGLTLTGDKLAMRVSVDWLTGAVSRVEIPAR